MLPLYKSSMTLGSPVIDLVLARRVRQGKEDARRLAERRGQAALPRPDGRLVWVHAVSVGESITALGLIERLLRTSPDLHVLVTTGTVSSAGVLADRLPERASHQFIPIDRPAWVRRFLEHWRPDLAIVMESDFWPALLMIAHERGIPIVAANARMSTRSFDRWRLVRGISRPVFSALDLVLATSSRQAGQFRALGARRISVPGNLKRAADPLPLDEAEAAGLARAIGSRRIWLAASTHAGEDEAIFSAHRQLLERHPDLLVILAPRHPERGPAIADQARAHGMTVARRAASEPIGPDLNLYIADTFGEMSLFFHVASVVFVAGSLVPVGGHNPVEPAHFDCAILFGPLMSKNRDIADEMTRDQAAVQLPGADALAPTVDAILRDEARRRALSENARRYASEGDAVLDAISRELAPFLGPRTRPAT